MERRGSRLSSLISLIGTCPSRRYLEVVYSVLFLLLCFKKKITPTKATVRESISLAHRSQSITGENKVAGT